MTLEIRIKYHKAEIHVVDSQNNRPISIIKSSLETLSSDIVRLMSIYKVCKVKRVKKPLLVNP